MRNKFEDFKIQKSGKIENEKRWKILKHENENIKKSIQKVLFKSPSKKSENQLRKTAKLRHWFPSKKEKAPKSFYIKWFGNFYDTWLWSTTYLLLSWLKWGCQLVLCVCVCNFLLFCCNCSLLCGFLRSSLALLAERSFTSSCSCRPRATSRPWPGVSRFESTCVFEPSAWLLLLCRSRSNDVIAARECSRFLQGEWKRVLFV